MPSPRKRIGELLIAAGVIDPLDLQAALAHQRQWGGQLGATLIDRGFISEKALVETLSQQLGLPIVKLAETPIDPRALPLVPARLCEHLRVFPLRLEEGTNNKQILILAMVDPTDLAAVDQIKFHSGHQVSPLLAADQDIGNAVRRWYHGRDPLQSVPPEQAPGLDPFTDLSIASRPRTGAGPIQTAPAPGDLVPEEAPISEAALESADLEEIAIDVDENEFSIPSLSAASAPAAATEEEVDPVAEGWLIPDEEPAGGEAHVLPAGEETFEAPAETGWDAPVEMQPATAAADWSATPDFGGSTADWEDAPPVSLANAWDAPPTAESAREAEWDAPAGEAEESGEPVTIAPPSAAQWAVAVSQDVEQSWDAPPPAAALAETELPTVRIALSARGSSTWAEPPKATNDREEPEEVIEEEPLGAAAAWATVPPPARVEQQPALVEEPLVEEPFANEPLIEEPVSAAAAWATATHEPAFEPLVEEPVRPVAPMMMEFEPDEPKTIFASRAEPSGKAWAAPAPVIADQPSYSFSGPATDWALGIAEEETSLTVADSESQRWAIDTNQTVVPTIEEPPSEPTVHVERALQPEAEPQPEVAQLTAPEVVEAAPEPAETASDADAMMALDSSDLIGGFDDPIEPVVAPEPEHVASEPEPSLEIAPAVEEHASSMEPIETSGPIDVDLGEFTRSIAAPPIEAAPVDEQPVIPEAEPEEPTHAISMAPAEVAHVDEPPVVSEMEPEEPTHAISMAPAEVAHIDEPPAVPEAEPEELTHATETAPVEVAHVDEPVAEPEELTHATETAPVEVAHAEEPEAEPVEITPPTEAVPIEAAHIDEPPAVPEAEPIAAAPPSEATPVEVSPISLPPGFTPSPLSARPTEPLEITPPARITFPPGQGLVIESPVVTAPMASRQGWTLLGIENPTPSDAVDVMGALVNLLVGRGTVSTSELTEAIRKLREPSE